MDPATHHNYSCPCWPLEKKGKNHKFLPLLAVGINGKKPQIKNDKPKTKCRKSETIQNQK